MYHALSCFNMHIYDMQIAATDQLCIQSQTQRAMEGVPAKQPMEIYLPYFFRVNEIFSEEFLEYAVNEVACMNEAPVVLFRSSAEPVHLSVRCAVDPKQCRFRLEFLQTRGEEGARGFRLTECCTTHFCEPQFDERAVLRDRAELIRVMRPEMVKLVERRGWRAGQQPSKVVMRQLAVQYGQFPNFLYRGLSRKTQLRISAHFERTVRRILSKLDGKRRNGDIRALIDGDFDSDEEDSSEDDVAFARTL